MPGDDDLQREFLGVAVVAQLKIEGIEQDALLLLGERVDGQVEVRQGFEELAPAEVRDCVGRQQRDELVLEFLVLLGQGSVLLADRVPERDLFGLVELLGCGLVAVESEGKALDEPALFALRGGDRLLQRGALPVARVRRGDAAEFLRDVLGEEEAPIRAVDALCEESAHGTDEQVFADQDAHGVVAVPRRIAVLVRVLLAGVVDVAAAHLAEHAPVAQCAVDVGA